MITYCCTTLLLAVLAAPPGFSVQHEQLADLGGEHLAQAIVRHTRDGDAIVAWGERVVEWPHAKQQMHEVFARQGDLHFYNGGCALDIDGDGNDEIVFSRGRTRSGSDPELLWLQEQSPDQPWKAYRIDMLGNGPIAPHDIHPFAVKRPNGNPVRGVVVVLGRRVLKWYEIPADPAQPWLRHNIAELPLESQSGLAVGDLAGCGRPDVACGMFWAECPADPLQGAWRVHRFGRWEDGGWGGMTKLAIADMDGDGKNEIVASEAEIPNARLGVFTADPGQPDAPWKCREIERGLYCPHSLELVDLDGDSRMDIITGEMTAGGWDFPLNENPRIIAFLNRGEQPFERRVLAEGQGVHEMHLLPERPGRSLRLFAADEIQPQKFPQMKTRVGIWTISHSR
jgi:hypothetical protein